MSGEQERCLELATAYYAKRNGSNVPHNLRSMFADPSGTSRNRSRASVQDPRGIALFEKARAEAQAELQSDQDQYVAAMNWLATNYQGTDEHDQQNIRNACGSLAATPLVAQSTTRAGRGSILTRVEQNTFSQLRQSCIRMYAVSKLFVRTTVLIPCLLATACCFVAIHVTDEQGLGDEEYEISQLAQGQWSAALSKPSIDVGSEAHEMLGLVLGFLLAFQAQQAADRYANASAVFHKMCGSLQDAAAIFFTSLKNCKATSNAKLHWEFARSLHILLFVSSRDLQTGSLKGRSIGEKHTFEALAQFDGIAPAQLQALIASHGVGRVHMASQWAGMIVESSVDKGLLGEAPADKVRACLDEFHLQWREARTIAYAEEPELFYGLVTVLLIVVCCTLPLSACRCTWRVVSPCSQYRDSFVLRPESSKR